MRTITIGIDPGASGALAAWINDDKPVIHTLAKTDAHDAIFDVVCCCRNMGYAPVAYLEQVQGFIGEGQPGSAMFKFGDGYGYIRGVLRALCVSTVLVRPQTWQKGLPGMATLKKAERKRALRDEAARRFPNVKVTLDNCDALLIADYGQRMERGNNT